jgi:hypothetical protein
MLGLGLRVAYAPIATAIATVPRAMDLMNFWENNERLQRR